MANGRRTHKATQSAERAQAVVIEEVLNAAGLTFTYVRAKHLQVVCEGARIGISSTPRDIGNAMNGVRQRAQRLVTRVQRERGSAQDTSQ